MESITFFRSYYEAIRELDPDQQLAVYNAMMSYALDGVEPELSGAAKAVFILMRPNIDSSNRLRQRNIENGANGGRPSQKNKPSLAKEEETQEEPKENPSETQEEPKDNPEKEKEKDKDKEIGDKEQGGVRGGASEISCQRVAQLYNDICVSLPSCGRLSEKRKRAIRARISGGLTEADFCRLFEMAQASSFLRGESKSGWQADFDWLIQPDNAQKVLGGNYNQVFSGAQNKSAQTGGESSLDMDKLHRMLHGQELRAAS